MKEVITLQFGEQANYVGAHYWNLMQAATSDAAASAHPSGALSMDTLFCERDGGGGRGARRYTPRALVFDQPGNYMAQGDPDAEEEKEQEAEKAEEASVQWNGQQVEVHRQTPYARQPPPLLHESTPRYWTDILEQPYGAQTVHGISGVEFGSSLGQMATFNEGRNVFTGMNAREDMLEGAFRNYAEACDQLQGFQALSDAQGGFAGFGMAFLECVRQEYPKSPIVLYNAQAARLQQIGVAGRVDVAVALASALEQDVSMSVPLFAPPRVAGLYGGGAWMAANVAQWSWGVVAGVQGLGDVVDCATRQRGFRVAETLLAPGLDVGAADDL
ncbi:mtDNA inheritance, partitioning of the mitochondrial organelle, partial [Coemansia sp. RSA 2703]